MKVKILNPEKTLFLGEVDQITLPGELGTFTVLPKHAPLISVLNAGTITYRQSGINKEDTLNILGGFVKIQRDTVLVCID